MKALVTGAGGFAGGYLVEHLISSGVEVSALIRKDDSPPGPLGALLRVYEVDLRAKLRLTRVLRECAPDLVFHLAAQSSSAAAWQDPMGTMVNNIGAQTNLLDAIIVAGQSPRIVIVSSNEVYGPPLPGSLPVNEAASLRPINPYAVSKAAQDHIAYQYFMSKGLQCIRVRPFNHTGPRQRDSFAIPSFARQIAEAEAGLRPPVVHVGNLDLVRDFSDVRDIVRGYYLAAVRGEPGAVYNLGSGRPISLREVVQILVGESKLSMSVEVEPERLRPSDISVTYCDASRARKELGWEPEIPLEQTLQDVLEYWRGEVGAIPAVHAVTAVVAQEGR